MGAKKQIGYCIGVRTVRARPAAICTTSRRAILTTIPPVA